MDITSAFGVYGNPVPLDPEEMASFVNEFVVTYVRENPDVMIQTDCASQVMEKVFVTSAVFKNYAVDARKLQTVQTEMEFGLAWLLRSSCHDFIHANKFTNVANAAITALLKRFAHSPVKAPNGLDLVERLRFAFVETRYYGDAEDKFIQYVQRCWVNYNPKNIEAPYATVVQSSGFGKSRMLYEVARKAQVGWKESDQSLDLKVIYTCMRDRESPGYPAATPCLRKWLLPTKSTAKIIASRLLSLYRYAEQHWENVQDEWIDLFIDEKADYMVEQKLKQAQSYDVGTKALISSDIQRTLAGKVILLVVDEARHLLDDECTSIMYDGIVNDLSLLRRALVLVNNQINADGGIFGVLIDTSLKIADFTPSIAHGLSTRNNSKPSKFSFPPFVLTHTMDAHWKLCIKTFASNSKSYRPIAEAKEGVDDDTEGEELQYTIAAYKAAVLSYEKNAFLTLLRMGRPLWWSTYISESFMPPMEDVEYFAASKLLLGSAEMFDKTSMYGVASMFCRLGLRPRVTSALASHAVADLMATLAYVTYENNGCICSYASDPVLASGAIRVWHRRRNVLESDILPQLRKLILDEVVDTGGLDVMVARVLLLLAMDESIVGHTNYCSHWFGSQFATVYAFLEVLQVCELKMIYSEDVAHFDEAMNLVTFKSWLAQWKDWRMGFTHFVQLQSEPSEDTLWYLLGRRAAGICPRDQDGANLIIPMFCPMSDNASGMETDETKVASDGKVAMILIYVSDHFSIESGFCFFDETKERNAAKETNEKTTAPCLTQEELLQLESVQEVIRINMNLSGEVTPKTPAKFIHYASFGDENDVFSYDSESSEESVEEEATTMGFTFCLTSLDCTTFPFLHEELAQCLASFLGSRFNRIAYVDNDLRHRPNQNFRTWGDVILLKTMPDKKLREIALDGLGHVPGQH